MTFIADPNWLSIASAVFVLSGICFLAKGAMSDPATRTEDAAQRLARANRTVDFSIGLPLIVLGAMLNVVGQLVQLPFNLVAIALMLSLAYALLLYLATHDLLVDRVLARNAPKQRTAAKISLLPSPAIEPRDVAPEPRTAEMAAQS